VRGQSRPEETNASFNSKLPQTPAAESSPASKMYLRDQPTFPRFETGVCKILPNYGKVYQKFRHRH